METSLHRDLKRLYGDQNDHFEVALGAHRIDVIADGRLVEIQLGSLAAIRDKVRTLVEEHRVVVVKPIVVQKTLVKRASKGGPVAQRRKSPKRGTILDLFDELVHFTQAFPHERLTLEVPLIDIEEWRYPGHGRRRRWRRDDYQVEDQKLIAVRETYGFETGADLMRLIRCPLPRRFHTGQLAEALGVPRWTAQGIAYCLRPVGSVCEVGKQGNTRLYQFAAVRKIAWRWPSRAIDPWHAGEYDHVPLDYTTRLAGSAVDMAWLVRARWGDAERRHGVLRRVLVVSLMSGPDRRTRVRRPILVPRPGRTA
jgi:hypothetical protein